MIIILQEDGTIRTPGRSFGYGTNHLSLVGSRGKYLILHKKASQDWGGIGLPSSYYPVRYIVYEIRSQDGNRIQGDVIGHVEPRHRSRQVRKELLDLLEQDGVDWKQHLKTIQDRI